jgi:hypothetical protein
MEVKLYGESEKIQTRSHSGFLILEMLTPISGNTGMMIIEAYVRIGG